MIASDGCVPPTGSQSSRGLRRTRTSWHVNDTLHEACVALHRERIDIIIIYHLVIINQQHRINQNVTLNYTYNNELLDTPVLVPPGGPSPWPAANVDSWHAKSRHIYIYIYNYIYYIYIHI